MAPRLSNLRLDLNTHELMASHSHGTHDKDVIVLHETISPDALGMSDIVGVEKYLAAKDYGIHGMTDLEGHIAYALGLGHAIFYQCGGINERSIGIEQVSNVPLRSPSNVVRRKLWAARNKELRATAALVGAISKVHYIPLVYSDGRRPGVTTHYSVSQWAPESEGHTDCHPVHLGGYYPALEVIAMARLWRKARGLL